MGVQTLIHLLSQPGILLRTAMVEGGREHERERGDLRLNEHNRRRRAKIPLKTGSVCKTCVMSVEKDVEKCQFAIYLGCCYFRPLLED
jgi:hypothetical protein